MPPKRRKSSSSGIGDPNRRADGKFAKGNNANPRGNPAHRKHNEYMRSVRESVSGDELKKLLRRLLERAHEGDMVAAKLVLERTLGKATAAPQTVEVADLDIGSLATTEDITNASGAIVKAVTEGRLSPDDASKLASVVELTRRALETHELAQRVAELERDLPSRDSSPVDSHSS